MHSNEQYEGHRLCASVEIETHLLEWPQSKSAGRKRPSRLGTTMLSDAHYLGADEKPRGNSGEALLEALEPKHSQFLAIFRPENCLSRSHSTTAGLIRPLITHCTTTLFSLSTDVYQTVSPLSIPDLDQTSIFRSPSLRRRETRLNPDACE
jgi:hypothetical protein